MGRVATFLLLCVVACGLSLVYAQYTARNLFIALERAQAAEKQINFDWARLQYDQSALSKSARISEAARAQLHMMSIKPGLTQYLSMPATEQAKP